MGDSRDDGGRRQTSIARRLVQVHEDIRGEQGLSSLNRVAVALYDERTDLLKTFVHSSDGASPVDGSVAPLAASRSLSALAVSGQRRVIDDLEGLAAQGHDFARRLFDAGYRSSYTVPITGDGSFFGFLFFNSFRSGFFTPAHLRRLKPYADLISLAVMRELDTVRMMQAAVKVIRAVSSARDEETGSHLARMAHYARLIAVRLRKRHGLDDEYVEYLFQFCPLHDVGKVAVPDAILLKPGRLTADEFQVMKGHVAKGVEIIDRMMAEFGLGAMPHAAMLRNIVAFHHEAPDGSGYPHGLAGADIPVEARIAAVADVFDALTSVRPYKSAWTNQDAFDLLSREAGAKFDPDCVAALVACRADIERIQRQFAETVFD